MMADGCDSCVEALRAALGGDDLAWLRERVHARLRLGRGLAGTVTLEGPTREQVAAVGRLLGRRLRATRRLQVSLAEVSAALARAGLAADVADAVQRLDGPVTDEKAARAATETAWAAVEGALEEAAAGRPELRGWVRRLRATGYLRRVAADPAEGLRLVERALRVLEALPASGVRLARLADDRAGGAHALDADTELGRLVLGAVRSLVGEPTLEGAEGRRESWAAAGVLEGDLTSQVLVLNLRGSGSGLCDRLLGAGADHGEPVALTLGQLTRHPPDLAWAARRTISVCENVTVLAEAADRLGPDCAPLVCACGQPTVAVMRLLGWLTETGARLRFHGDFDWDGINIANRVLRATGATPWRFGTQDYLGANHDDAPGLKGAAVDATWDPELRPAMAAAGVAIEEERVSRALLSDLADR